MKSPSLGVSFLLLATTFLIAGCFGGDDPTTASFTATPINADKTAYRFDAGGSKGSGLSFQWDFGDRSPPGTKRVEEHTYEYPNGEYSVTLTVTGKGNTTSRVTQRVQVGAGSNTDPLLYLSADRRWVTPNDTVTFDATESFDEDGDPLFFEWDFNSPLSEQEFANMQDLGFQQYGRYQYGPPPGAGGNGSGGSGSGGDEPLRLTPSGHDWKAEYERAKQRLLSSRTRDGGHGSSEPEPRNTDFDGRIDDTAPIQIFQFPSPATYFVHLRVYDIKGARAEGFLKIKVSDSVPAPVENHEARGVVVRAGTGVDAVDADAAYKSHAFNYNYSGYTDIRITFVRDPAGTPDSLTARVSLYVCSATNAFTACKSAPAMKAENVASPGNLTHTFDAGQTFPAGFRVWVLNTGQAQLKYDITYPTYLDLNPWAAHESGLMKGH